jgi:DICT domain-containing protein/predicted DNA-binding transcriptional regulator AlpA
MNGKAEEAPGRDSLRIRDVVERTGVAEATLRAWEKRYGFPQPRRLASGHRRYSESDVGLLRQIAELRQSGLPVGVAIERARTGRPTGPRSIFAGLRELRPELQVRVYPKRSLVALSHAIEDEGARGAEDLVMFGAFQRESHYRDAEPRWRELAKAAQASFAFADFDRPRRPKDGPIEVPIDARDPLAREWSIVCESSRGSACLVAWEPPGQGEVIDAERLFETIWTADRETARGAARICCGLASADAPEEVSWISEQLAGLAPRSDGQLRHAESLTARMVAYLTSGAAEAG